jgi:putative peptidoglycan lipid II flippase
VGPGGQSALYYSNRLFQLPLAIFGISLAQAVLPTFSSQMVKGDIEGFKKTFSVSLRTLSMIVMPASVGLVVLSRPIVRIVFEHGHFDAYSTRITSSALFFYGLGLLSCSFVKIFVNAFYAMQDTRTPVRTMGAAVALNVVFCFLLMKPFGIGGLTLASSLSATVNVWMLYRALSRRVGHLDEPAILRSLSKIAAASALMGLFAWGFDAWVLSTEAASAAPRAVQALLLAGGITTAVLLYCVFALAFRVEEAKKFYEKIFHPRLPQGADRGAS